MNGKIMEPIQTMLDKETLKIEELELEFAEVFNNLD